MRLTNTQCWLLETNGTTNITLTDSICSYFFSANFLCVQWNAPLKLQPCELWCAPLHTHETFFECPTAARWHAYTRVHSHGTSRLWCAVLVSKYIGGMCAFSRCCRIYSSLHGLHSTLRVANDDRARPAIGARGCVCVCAHFQLENRREQKSERCDGRSRVEAQNNETIE